MAWCVGNHDVRPAFRSVLGGGHVGRAGEAAGSPLVDTDRCAAVSVLDGLRIVTLDSLVPGQTHGDLDDAQLSALREVLRQPAAHGTVLALHHPPIAIDTPFWRSVNLQHPERLVEVVEGSHVRAILCGHNHLQLSGRLGDVAVWVTPATSTRIDLTVAPGLERAVTGGGATVVDLDAPGGPLFTLMTARDPAAGREVCLVDITDGHEVDHET